ncbi:MAG: ABC transporter permease [Acidobacteriota bacterium]
MLLAAALFVIADHSPGDAAMILQMDPAQSPAAIEAQARRLGLEDGPMTRYRDWLFSVAKGDGGWSALYGRPAGPLIWHRAENTLVLAGLSLFGAWCLAFLSASAAPLARRRPEFRILDRLLTLASALLLSTPSLILGMVLAAWALQGGSWPVGGSGDPELSWAARWPHLFLPSLTLVAATWPWLHEHLRNALIQAQGSLQLLAARGRGLSGLRLFARHLLPATAATVFPLLGWSAGGLLSGTVVVETLFSWPGLGTLLVDATLGRDLHVIASLTLLSGGLVVVANAVANLAHEILDPRLRPVPTREPVPAQEQSRHIPAREIAG